MSGPSEVRIVDGAGNRFLLWDACAGAGPRDPVAALRATGDATLDGLLLVEPGGEGARARLVVVNRDGSRPEMCGNGLRCVALHLSGGRAAEFVVETDAGPRRCRVTDEGVAWVSLGRATVGAAFDVTFGGTRLPAFEVDVGNPHAALDAAGLGLALRDAPLAEVAAAVAATGRFPRGVNVELALNHGDHLEARVHERGVGETQACGTGAAALAAVALEHLEHGPPVRVHMPGGILVVDRDDDGGELWLSGPAQLGPRLDVPT